MKGLLEEGAFYLPEYFEPAQWRRALEMGDGHGIPSLPRLLEIPIATVEIEFYTE